MDLHLAIRHIFGGRPQLAALARATYIACIPIIGSLLLTAYALQYLRAAAFETKPTLIPLRLDVQTLWVGVKCQLLSLAATLTAGLLTLPLLSLDHSSLTSSSSATIPSTVLMASLTGPTAFLSAGIAAVLSALVIARYATTGSVLSALNVVDLWSQFRAEPTLWIATAVIGFILVEAPATIALLLPFSPDSQLTALLVATAFFWPTALFLQAHLIGRAHLISEQTIASRRPLIVHVRW